MTRTRGQGTITSQPATPLRRQRPRPANLPAKGTVAAEEAVQVHHHRQLRPHPTGLGEPSPLQAAVGQFREGIGAALAAATGVLGVGGAG